MPDLAQRLLALALLVILAPVIGALAILVRIDSPGPILFRATRNGRDGTRIVCLKLRTMSWEPQRPGHPIAVAADARVTRVGRLLRRSRLDELPQLLNVVRGDLRLVGPRPEDPSFIDLSDPLHRRVFLATPGITGLAQLFFLDEASLLRGADPLRTYREEVLPRKLALDARYLANRSVPLDLWIIAATISAVFGRRPTIDALHRWAPRTIDGE